MRDMLAYDCSKVNGTSNQHLIPQVPQETRRYVGNFTVVQHSGSPKRVVPNYWTRKSPPIGGNSPSLSENREGVAKLRGGKVNTSAKLLKIGGVDMVHQ